MNGNFLIRIAISFIILIAIYLVIYVRRLKTKEKNYKFIFSLFYFYISLVLFATIMPFDIVIPKQGIEFSQIANLKPFIDIIQKYDDAWLGVVFNVIMFIPFGILLPMLKKETFLKVLFFSFLFTLGIELIQLYYAWGQSEFQRVFDVTDIITNTFGGILGYLIYKIMKRTNIVK